MKIAIASDHGGFELKTELKNHYEKQGLIFKDLGTDCNQSCDYPDIAKKMAVEILSKNSDLGILICGTGIGISIAANRHKGIRAAILYSNEVAKLAKQHNDANVVVFGGRTQSLEDVIANLDAFLKTEFEGDRHIRRINKMDEM